MTPFFISIVSLLALVALVEYSEGHGYMLQPPGRGTAWRKGFKTPPDYNDNGYNCGGKGVQHNSKNNHRCGVCGNEFSSPSKSNEPGPGNRYATGVIVAKYQAGQTIDVTVMATAFHKGYYEFRLCQNDIPQKGRDASIAVTQECMDKNLLTAPDGSTKFKAVPLQSTHKVKLPDGVGCSNCVLQWRYRAGNSWGCDRNTRKCGNGYGYQEEFWNCADIAIGGGSKQAVRTQPTRPEVATQEPASEETEPDTTVRPTQPTRPKPRWTQPPKPVTQAPKQQPPQPAQQQPKQQPPARGRKVCRGAAPYGARLNSWCDQMCNYINPYCPRSHCRCN